MLSFFDPTSAMPSYICSDGEKSTFHRMDLASAIAVFTLSVGSANSNAILCALVASSRRNADRYEVPREERTPYEGWTDRALSNDSMAFWSCGGGWVGEGGG